ncbi:hypothetical protein EJ04DRAFT_476043 [Polyplosphaeria fusca]|uniref:Uncharacterized protein n=1 Tax=Polyplosphaeria fusca TaxID=682080 RepID=A0A9P4UXN3_9PLEO|nr:hypothetical protein EJ04DRAFT_476043 [Polyplosphaeria fusca]
MSTCKSLTRICAQSSRSTFLPTTQRRHESTARRHKKLLHVQQAPSFTPDRASPTLIFNPPSSAPSVYHTPLKFLPREDKRKDLYQKALNLSMHAALRTHTPNVAAPGTPLSAPSNLPPRPSNALPPAVRTPYDKKYHLTDVEIDDIRRLRLEDPEYWTRARLAEKFECSQFFVSLIVKAPEKAARVEGEHAKMRARWGERRTRARVDRARRKELWGRDE